jgi:hypothetical protein
MTRPLLGAMPGPHVLPAEIEDDATELVALTGAMSVLLDAADAPACETQKRAAGGAIVLAEIVHQKAKALGERIARET